MAHQQDMLNGSSAGIPLHCNVCPRKPDFSDVSHLLTHIASKGHLSNYYKLKIKATSDRAAARGSPKTMTGGMRITASRN